MRWRLAAVASLMGAPAWAQAIREADTGVRIWENPNHRDMDQANQAMIDACHGRDQHGRELANGVYIYRLQAGEQVDTRKLLLLK